MPGNFDFSVVISQVPRVQKIQGDIQKGPFNLQEGIQREVEKKQEMVNKEIEESSKGSNFQKVGGDKEGKGGHEENRNKRRGKDKGQSEEQRDLKDRTRGRFVDIKV